MDNRVRAFHKENGGLSSARNLGLDYAKGEYIGFVDSDDWIEAVTYETMFGEFLKNNVDVCVVGGVIDSPGKIKKLTHTDHAEIVDSNTALHKLIVESYGSYVWNKLYKRKLFENIRFPEGYNFEDVRTTYKLMQKANLISLIPDALYHYVMYKESICHTKSPKNLNDNWIANKELYSVFANLGEEYRQACVRRLVDSSAAFISEMYRYSDKELKQYKNTIEDIASFAKEHLNDVLFDKNYSIKTKIKFSLTAANNRASHFSLCLITLIYRRLKRLIEENQVYSYD